jgi:hypothetical protein
MSFARAGKTAANEAKYPFIVIVEVPIAANGLNVELNRQIVGFHKLHHTTLRSGRTALRDGQIYYRWCFSIWRRRAPLPNSLAERFTKQPALDLRRFSR